MTLVRAGVSGWQKNPHDIPGKPDFYFADCKLAVFTDGCFWHACPKCARRMPNTNRDFWKKKIEDNRRRDQRTRRRLRQMGYHTLRIWEHEITSGHWSKRFHTMLERARKE